MSIHTLRPVFWLAVMPITLTPPYWLSNHITWFPAHPVPRLALDELIPFMPSLAWLYLGLFPFMWIAVLTQTNTRHAQRYMLGATACAWGVSLLFILFPTSYPRPHSSHDSALYAMIVAMDTDRNACPSLHGTYAAYSAAWLISSTRHWALHVCVIISAIAILAATIAVRQHGSLDLIAGIIIGLAAFYWAWPQKPAGIDNQ